MKIKNALLMIAAVLVIASAGETKAGPEAGQNLGTIIVYRPWSIVNCAIKNWEFNVNDGPDLTVRNGTYYRLTVLPGDYTISHGGIPFIDDDPQVVHVEPGQTVYFEYTVILSLVPRTSGQNREQTYTFKLKSPGARKRRRIS